MLSLFTQFFQCLLALTGRAIALQGMNVKGSREYVRSAVEGSLERLNIKQIDLYYQVCRPYSARN
jgi:aryl-alcohol dehydrogenase-like predicted oxidoreductase